MKKLKKWGLGIIAFIIVLIVFISILPETEEQKLAEQREKEKLIKIEQLIKTMSAGSVGEYISISEIEDDGSMYRIWISLLFEPENYRQVQTWTDAVCKDSRRLLEENGITRSISVWAKRSKGKDEVVVYGRTFHYQGADKSEFKKSD